MMVTAVPVRYRYLPVVPHSWRLSAHEPVDSLQYGILVRTYGASIRTFCRRPSVGKSVIKSVVQIICGEGNYGP